MAKETCKSLRVTLDELRSEVNRLKLRTVEARQGHEVRMHLIEERLRKIEEKLGWTPPAVPQQQSLPPYFPVKPYIPHVGWFNMAMTTGGAHQA